MPQFAPGESKTARVLMTNHKSVAFDYLGKLYLGIEPVALAEVPFNLAAGESRQIDFPVVMPSVAGMYPVFLDVLSNSNLLAHYMANEDVEILLTEPSLVSFEILTPPCHEGWVTTRAVYYVPASAGRITVGVVVPWSYWPNSSGSAYKAPRRINYATLDPGQWEVINEFRLRYDGYISGYTGYIFVPVGSYPLWFAKGNFAKEAETEFVQQVGTLDVGMLCTSHFSYSITCEDLGLVPGYTTLRRKRMTCVVTNNGTSQEMHTVRSYSWYKQNTSYYPSAMQKPGADLIDERQITLGPGQSTSFQVESTFNPVGINISKGFYVIDESCGKSADSYSGC